MRHFINIIALMIVGCLFGIFVYNDKIKITQEVLDLFPQTADKQVIDIYRQFSNSRHILVAIQGFNQESYDTLHAFLTALKDLPNIEGVMTRTTSPAALEEFLMENYFYTATPKPLNKVLTKQQIEERVLHGLATLQAQMLEEEQLDKGMVIQQTEITHSKENIIDSKQKESLNQQTPLNSKQYDISKDEQNSITDTYNTFFHPSDPLQLLTLHTPKPYIFIAKDYGYMALVTMKDIQNEAVQETFKGFTNIAKKYPNIRYFSQNFMNVENLDLILQEVNFLLSFTSIAFIMLYFVIIRIPLLTLNTICTLIIANIIAILIVSSVYPKVTIMALIFGTGISNIAIDYMMHHNFFDLYVGRKKVFNRPVFYGYITTIIGFSACLFVPFPLLAQLSLYAIISLTFCYISFAFIYPYIGFSQPRLFPRLANIRYQVIPSYWFLGIALCGFVFAFMYLRIDFDLSKLDYQNKPMLQERTFFTDAQGNTTQVLLSSDSLDGLIGLARALQTSLQDHKAKTFIPLALMPTTQQIENNTHFIKSQLVKQNKKALLQTLPYLKKRILHTLSTDASMQDMGSVEDREGFVDDLFAMFQESYELPVIPILTLDILQQMGFSIVVTDNIPESQHSQEIKDIEHNTTQKEMLSQNDSIDSKKKRFYYLVVAHNEDLAYISQFANTLNASIKEDNKQITENNSIEMRGLQHIMDNLANTIYVPMLVVLAIALCLMFCMLFITARKAFLDSVVFVLFPLSCALCLIASHTELNIMHLFALLILVVVSIDYGIYSVKEGDNPRTAHAIFFSALTTGVSFGIFIMSKTKALNSFGEVVFIGMACILCMLVFHRPINKK